MCKKNYKKFNIRNLKAFSLLELSLVILITSILMVGALSISVNAVNNARIELTKERMEKIYKALGNYVLRNKRLPCPAQIKKSELADADYGQAAVNAGSCNFGANTSLYTRGTLSYGMVPVRDLDLPLEMAQDAYGNKIAYIVDKYMTTHSGFESMNADIDVAERPGSVVINLNPQAAFVLISAGQNQLGAFGANSGIQNTLPTNGDEIANTIVGIDESGSTPSGWFAKAATDTIVTSSGNNDVFDDIVFYKTKLQIATDFDTWDYFACPAGTSNRYGIDFSWAKAYFGQVVISSTLCPVGYRGGAKYPTRRCENYHNWGSSVVQPCIAG